MTGERRQVTGERRLELGIAALFGVAALAGLALLGLYVMGGQTQLEAVLLAVCLGGIGVGIVIWAQRLLPNDVTIEDRASHDGPPRDSEIGAGVDPDGVDPTEGSITRRSLLVRALGVAFGGLAAALAIPVLSLGPAPSASRFHTPWKAGLRLVGLDGKPVTSKDVPLDGVMTVFPEGAPGSPNGQTVLVHVEEALLRLPRDRAGWAPEGFVAYSKLCTHAGCPVGLYRAGEHRLICPCHQSTFDVLDGAVPSFGPAARPLPQLPIRLEADGTFTALGDFPEPVGPSFWDMSHGG